MLKHHSLWGHDHFSLPGKSERDHFGFFQLRNGILFNFFRWNEGLQLYYRYISTLPVLFILNRVRGWERIHLHLAGTIHQLVLPWFRISSVLLVPEIISYRYPVIRKISATWAASKRGIPELEMRPWELWDSCKRIIHKIFQNIAKSHRGNRHCFFLLLFPFWKILLLLALNEISDWLNYRSNLTKSNLEEERMKTFDHWGDNSAQDSRVRYSSSYLLMYFLIQKYFLISRRSLFRPFFIHGNSNCFHWIKDAENDVVTCHVDRENTVTQIRLLVAILSHLCRCSAVCPLIFAPSVSSIGSIIDLTDVISVSIRLRISDSSIIRNSGRSPGTEIIFIIE